MLSLEFRNIIITKKTQEQIKSVQKQTTKGLDWTWQCEALITASSAYTVNT
jgi:hypothetical protein